MQVIKDFKTIDQELEKKENEIQKQKLELESLELENLEKKIQIISSLKSEGIDINEMCNNVDIILGVSEDLDLGIRDDVEVKLKNPNDSNDNLITSSK